MPPMTAASKILHAVSTRRTFLASVPRNSFHPDYQPSPNMAQGLLKKPSKPSKPSSSSASGNSSNSKATSGKITKKGSRTITPKKASLVRQAKLNKKFTAGLTAKTEAMLGARAGHLEMLGQGASKGGQKGHKNGATKGGNKAGRVG